MIGYCETVSDNTIELLYPININDKEVYTIIEELNRKLNNITNIKLFSNSLPLLLFMEFIKYLENNDDLQIEVPENIFEQIQKLNSRTKQFNEYQKDCIKRFKILYIENDNLL